MFLPISVYLGISLYPHLFVYFILICLFDQCADYSSKWRLHQDLVLAEDSAVPSDTVSTGVVLAQNYAAQSASQSAGEVWHVYF